MDANDREVWVLTASGIDEKYKNNTTNTQRCSVQRSTLHWVKYFTSTAEVPPTNSSLLV